VKLLFFANTSWYLWNFRRGLIERFLELGYEVVVVAPDKDYSSRLKEIGCTTMLVRLDNKGLNPLRDLSTIFHLWGIYRKQQPAFAFHFTVKSVIYGTIVGSLLGVRCVNTVTGLGTAFIGNRWSRKIVGTLYKCIKERAQWTFFQNKEDFKLFRENRYVRSDRASVVAGAGINLTQFAFSPSEPNSFFRFLYLGRLLFDKGLLELKEAAKQITESRSDVRVQILGPIESKNPTAVSSTILNAWIAEKSIEYLGQTDDVSEFIVKANCVVLPSFREGTPRSLLEAAAIGRPIVATDVPGCREVVIDEKNGFLCQPGSVKELVEAMQKMLNLTHEQRLAMGQAGRQIVEDSYSEQKVIDSYLSLVQRIEEQIGL